MSNISLFVRQLLTITLLCAFSTCYADTVKYQLSVAYKSITHQDKTTQGMAVNDSIPAPTLYFTEGDTALINVINNMDVPTSVHWHGILLPNHQDGVPYVNHPPIQPNESHLFTFKLKQTGTYWYHSHTGLQEQRGVYGAIVIKTANKNPLKFDQEKTVVLSDWTHENPDAVLHTLKSGNDYYSVKKNSEQNLWSAVQNKGVVSLLKQRVARIPKMDISDIAYDLFLANGLNETFIPAKVGEVIKLRLVNASASTYFSLQFAQGDVQIIAADGIDVVPFEVDDFLMAVAETYTLLIKITSDGLFELRATAQDGSGHSSIWMGEGTRIFAADKEKPNIYQMPMAGMTTEVKMATGIDMKTTIPISTNSKILPHNTQQPTAKQSKPNLKTAQVPYKNLKALTKTTLPTQNNVREIVLNLTGDMERYIWSINNEVLAESNMIKIKRGENIRFVLINKTMMHHPMHLHGHFFRVINGQGEYSPLKHTVDVQPMGRQVIEFVASEKQDWFFHCHILYHAQSGMARVIRYEDDVPDASLASIRHNLYDSDIFYSVEGLVLSQMTDGLVSVSKNKNSLHADWQVGWQNTDDVEYEVNVTYERYIDRFLSGFVGIGLENEFERGIVGVNYLLPLNFESQWRFDTDGKFRISLGNDVQLTNNLNIFSEFEYDTGSNIEWEAGLHYAVIKTIGLAIQYHSEFGIGGGIKFSF